MTSRISCLSEHQRELYLRNTLVPEIGEEGQARLLDSRVLVIGAGGLGSPALHYLAATGIGELGIADGDTVSLSNLQRQILYSRDDLGAPKCFAAEERLSRMQPHLRYTVYPHRITPDNAREIIEPYQFVIDATDNFESKFLVNDVCVQLGKPFSHAGVMDMQGQTMTVIPGKSPCYRCVFGDIPLEGSAKNADSAGILGSVAGVIGSIQATEAVKYLLRQGELLTGRLLTWDALKMVFRLVKLPATPGCPVCEQMQAKHQNSRG